MEFISILDHTPLVVTTEVVVPRGNSPFKFNNAIVDHPNFSRIVADGLKQNIHGCSMFKYPSLLALANRTRGQTIMLRKAEPMKFAQLIKNRYLLQADKCSKFFHALIKRNRHSRFIAAIRLEDGHNTSSQDEIALAFVNHFRNLFSARVLTQTPSISICNRGPKLSHLAFADDIMLLSRGDIPSMSTIFSKLQHFCRVLGASISSDKSAIYSAGIRTHELSHIQQLTGFSLGGFPFRYLSVPLLSSRLNVCHYAPLLSKITGLIQGWSRKSLSYAGKLELIRAVIQGIVNFWIGIFPLPQSVMDRINASCRNFLWGKVDIGKNKPLVAWSVVCSPKKKGGLGLFNLKDWNLKDSLWVRWVHHYYFRRSDKIIQIRDFIISKELSTEEAKKRIQSWSTNGQLLVGKVYEYIRGAKPTISWCSVIWNPAIPPKMSFILWLAKRNRLLTLDKTTFLNKGSLCPLCSNEAESNAHLFFSCRKSLQVWAHIRDLAPFHRRFTSLQCITNSLIRGRSTSGVQGTFRCLAIAITVYCIWLSRNKLIFEDYQFSVIEYNGNSTMLHLKGKGSRGTSTYIDEMLSKYT
ncbi:putative ribonuclease H protein [Glycine max]|nr:putative ribonuclease H protein [Glycine max]